MGALSIEQVLAEETDAIFGEHWHNQLVRPIAGQDNEARRVRMNADERDGTDLPPSEAERREKFYRALNKLNRAALCCSGGGIRSATFCLGVIQALAGYDVTRPAPKPRSSAATGKPADAADAVAAGTATADAAAAKLDKKLEITPENSVLGRIHYLSTVSGGGYVGSWLSSWRARNDFATVIGNLTGRPSGADVEPPEISWLRAYSNYLTPRLGITSADAWAAIAISARNLVLNWLVIIPVVCVALLALKVVAAASVRTAQNAGPDSHCAVVVIGAAGVVALIGALAFTTRHRPSRRAKDDNVYEPTFLWRDLIWAVISAITITIFFTSHDFAKHLEQQWLGLDFMSWWQGLSIAHELLILTAAAGLLIYAVGWILGSLLSWRARRDPNLSAEESRRRGSAWVDLVSWMASGLIYGALVGAGAYLFSLLEPYPELLAKPGPAPLWDLLLPMIFGVPWVLMAQMVADIAFAGLTSAEPDSDSDREWLGRSAGWLATSAIVWALMALLVFAGGYFVQMAHTWATQVFVASSGAVGMIGGIATALMGSSGKTPAQGTADNGGGPTAFVFDIVMAVAGPIFGAALVIALSSGLDQVLLDGSLVAILHNRTAQAMPLTTILMWFGIGFVIVGAVALLASYCVNINRFSLHALYRNRLIRGYLGASRQQRDPDHFTGFDIKDNIRVNALWPPKTGDGANPRSLFHVVNIALNVVSTKRLAWQERKAEPFTVSPLHAGSAFLGFRPSWQYGDGPMKSWTHRHDDGAGPETDKNRHGISLGTAMAISGAAVSPNMGYSSSPSITLLLTLFNVRLGWWLGNPGDAGEDSYQSEGPTWAAKPLIQEAFGQTTDARSFVYLSDGGHFENLGLYEMVRRRCRFIIVVDAGCDPKFAFADLGNAVRKIFIDLGIRITFRDLQALRNRPTEGASPVDDIPYFAVGTIHYKGADGVDCGNGHVLYVKPAYHGTEGAGIRSYATAHKEFPHESTLDQWFTESQFESYRSLGLDVMNDILDHEVEFTIGPQKLTLHQILADLPYVSRP
jgi:hypothetical protein